MKNIFTSNFDVTTLKISWSQLLLTIVYILLPNVFFLGVTYFTQTARPLINYDYILPALLFLIPHKLIRLIGVISLLVCFTFDALMTVIQVFPFMDLAAIRYFIPFVKDAPKLYIIAVCIAVICFVALVFLMLRLSKKVHRFNVVSMSLLIALFFYHTDKMDLAYNNFSQGIMGSSNYYYIQSQTNLYRKLTTEGFATMASVLPKMSPLPSDKGRAARNLVRPYSDKILFIIAESWGKMYTKEQQSMVLKNIYDQKDNFEFIQDGAFDFSGATVQAEMREVCDIAKSPGGFAFSQLPDDDFAQCIPNLLKKSGYATMAIHGASGGLYDRYSWYPKAGFDEVAFSESFPEKPHCESFHGICDSALFNHVADKFALHKDKKLFFYWLTLTSHFNYSEEDITNHRFKCEDFGLKEGQEICRNIQLNVQFLDYLAELTKRPEMKGVEVIVVGDHMPPLFSGADVRPYLVFNQVSWVHFKINK